MQSSAIAIDVCSQLGQSVCERTPAQRRSQWRGAAGSGGDVPAGAVRGAPRAVPQTPRRPRTVWNLEFESLIQMDEKSINFGGTHQIDMLSKAVMVPHSLDRRQAARNRGLAREPRVHSSHADRGRGCGSCRGRRLDLYEHTMHFDTLWAVFQTLLGVRRSVLRQSGTL